MLVPSLLQNHDFLEHFLALGVFSEILLVDAFNRHHLLRQVVQGQIYLTKGSLPKDFAYPIEVNSRGWG